MEALDCYCVDNAVARLGDPLFVGYCHMQRAEVRPWRWHWLQPLASPAMLKFRVMKPHNPGCR